MANNSSNTKNQKKTMPIIMLPDAVVFPGCPHQFTVFGSEMMEAIRKARKEDRCLFIMLNEKSEKVFPINQRVGVVATIHQILRHPEEESMNVRIMGEYRGWVVSGNQDNGYTMVDVVPADEVNDETEKDPTGSLHTKLFKNLVPELNRADEKPENQVQRLLNYRLWVQPLRHDSWLEYRPSYSG